MLQQLEGQARAGYVSPVAFASLHMGLGNADRALDYMEKGWEERRGWLVYLKVNPMVDPLRGHPRFESLVNRMGL